MHELIQYKWPQTCQLSVTVNQVWNNIGCPRQCNVSIECIKYQKCCKDCYCTTTAYFGVFLLLLLLPYYNWAANWVLASWTPPLSHCQRLDVWWKEGIKVSPIPTAPVINGQNFPIPLIPYPQLYSSLFPCRERDLTIMFWFANFSTNGDGSDRLGFNFWLCPLQPSTAQATR